MNIKQTTSRFGRKSVTFTGVTTESNDDLRAAAYAAAGERPENCFGTDIVTFDLEPGTVRVDIYTD